jgi:tetratricopeptide (TPR) repeat protein
MRSSKLRRSSVALILSLIPLAFGLSNSPTPASARTVRLKVVADEEFRKKASWILDFRQWLDSTAHFFAKNFEIELKIDDIEPWKSDDTKGSISELMEDLIKKKERLGYDIVLGFTGQHFLSPESSGISSYLNGYVLVQRLKDDELNRITVAHELCHLFGAIDIAEDYSIMARSNPQWFCDAFTREIVRINKDREFESGTFPLPQEKIEAAISLYKERKALNRGEVGVNVFLALCYVQVKNYDQAIKECLEANKIESGLPVVRSLLRIARERKS